MYLSVKGSSFIIKSTGQIEELVDLKTLTPSVFTITEILLSVDKGPSSDLSFLYKMPSFMSDRRPGMHGCFLLSTIN